MSRNVAQQSPTNFSVTMCVFLYLFLSLYHKLLDFLTSMCLLENMKAIIPIVSVFLQLFDGIECEFPIFFIYMVIDGKPCSIHCYCYGASSGSLVK